MLDTDRFSRIIHNLANNAMRHNPPGTQVSVSLTVQNNQIVIDFSDDGAGIPEHLKETIFRPFVRADSPAIPKPAAAGWDCPLPRGLPKRTEGT